MGLSVSQATNLILATTTNIGAILLVVSMGFWLWRLRASKTLLRPLIFGVLVSKFALWFWTLLLILSIVVYDQDPRAITLPARVLWLIAVLAEVWVTSRIGPAPGFPMQLEQVNARGPLVLIVEDNDALARLYRRALQNHGYQAEFVTTGVDALVMLDHEKPKLLIVDLGLPDMDGVQFITRAEQAGYSGPVIAISGAAGLIDEGKLAGRASRLLAKPFTIGELLDAVIATKVTA